MIGKLLFSMRDFKAKPLFLFGISSLFVLTACHGNYHFTSNIDPVVIDNYFQVRNIDIYQSSQQPTQPYQVVGIVTEEVCQTDPQDKPASTEQVFNQLREEAFQLQANGLIITGCSEQIVDANLCLSQALCSAQAIRYQPL